MGSGHTLCFIKLFSLILKTNPNNIFLSYLILSRYCGLAQTYLLCYQCVSTHPGCGTPFKWLWYKTVSCPEEDDICVKVTEKLGGNNYHLLFNYHI